MVDTTFRMDRDFKAAERALDKRDHISLGDIARFLTDFRTTIGGAVALCLAAAAIVLLRSPALYTAKAQLLIDARPPQVMREQWGEVSVSLDSAQLESQVAVLRSEQLALSVIKKLDLAAEPELGGSKESGPRPAVADPVEQLRRQRAVIGAYQGGIDIRRIGVSYVIDIAFTSRDPDRAALIANAAAQAYLDDQLAARAGAARQGSHWLEERIEELRKQMNSASLRVQEFKARRDYRIGNRLGASAASGVGAGDDGAKASEPPVARAASESLEELEATAQTYRKIYESYLQAYTESVQRQSYPVANARIITLATRPLTKSSPKTLRILLLASLLGAMAGIGLALMRRALAV